MVLQIVEEAYKDLFKFSPVPMLIIGANSPDFTVLQINDAYLSATNTKREELIGKCLSAVYHNNLEQRIASQTDYTLLSIHEAYSTKTSHTVNNFRYDLLANDGGFCEERYWNLTNTPILDENKNIKYFFHSLIDVTELNKSRKREKISEEALRNQKKQLYSTFMQAPVGIGIFKGPEYITELINPSLCEIYGKTENELLGKPIFEVLDHARGLGFEELLDHVRLTGQPYQGEGKALLLFRKGKLENGYLNFAYEPFRENDGAISGVIVVAANVTEYINAKKNLEEAEERARLSVDAVGLGTYDLNLLTNEIVTSNQFAKIFGFEKTVTRPEYIKRFHPDDLLLRERVFEEALKTGKLFYEARIVLPEKRIRLIRVEGKVHYNDECIATRIIGTILDITEQKKAREEQQKLITLVANSVDLMSILNLDGSNSYINEAGRNLMGYETEEEVLNTPLTALHAPECIEFLHNDVIPTVMREGRWSGKMLMRHNKTNEIFPVYKNTIRIDDPVDGKPINLGVVIRDMRPELAAKQALADSEELLRDITTAAPTGLWMADEDGNLTYVNQSWVDWTAIPFEGHLGRGWVNSIVKEDQEKAYKKFIADVSKRRKYESEFRIKHTDGSIHWIVANGKAQYRTDGTFSGYIGACVDITEQKNLQQQKDDFIGIASHELKTPITSIKAYTQVLERMLLKKGENKEAEMIKRMDIQLNRLTSLIGDLLDVTKINSGRLQFNDRDFDFNSLVTELIEDLQRTTEKHKLVENLESTTTVFGDKERIGQVITNLITNAIKYSPCADRIIISSSLSENEVTLCVEDFGIGISNDKLNKVFEQFYRVSGNLQHTFPGLGLGLYISSEIIKREGGKIWVNSVEGKGSIFCISMPLKQLSDSKNN